MAAPTLKVEHDLGRAAPKGIWNLNRNAAWAA
jgi:hypothetical protein